MLWNCEKENINEISEPQNSIEKIQQSFNKEDFVKSIPYEFEVNWDLGGKHYSEELKTDYYEFPIRYTSTLTPHINDFKKTKGNYYKSYKIIAIVKEKNITFYALRVYEKIVATGSPISKISLTAPSNFNGLMHLVDKENTIVYAKKLENGTNTIKDYFNKEFKKLDPYKSKMIEDCVTVTTTHYKDWYVIKDYGNGVIDVEYGGRSYLGTTTETICGYSYLPEYGGEAGGGGGSGPSEGEGTYQTNCVSPTSSSYQAKSAYLNTDPCAVKIINAIECGEGYVLGTDGTCKLPQIFNELTGKDKCIYDELKKLALFKSTIEKFSKGSYNLTFKYDSTCNNGAGEEACTDASDLANGNITVRVLSRNHKDIGFAATLLHEGIHAEIFKYVDEYKKGIDPNDRKNLFYWYNFYSAKNNNRKETSTAQHQHMQDVFVTPIATAIRQLDGNKHDIDYYRGFAFEGIIKQYGYDKYWENGILKVMTPEIFEKYKKKMNDVILNSKFNDIIKNCN